MPEMAVHQPMLFVGLGGTGCRVGSELERVMREGLCGPDGGDLVKRIGGHDYLPYQLPPCLQFVYADLSDAELRRVLPNVVPSAEHHVAAQHTTHLISNLVPPNIPGTPKLLQSMYVNMPPRLRDWLPPKATDPRVAPLTVGAGQLPTAGRAVLHESMRQGGGPGAVLHGVTAATQRINGSGAALRALGGRLGTTLDVFVAFSVAGGTGSGIFYDYLHMIGEHLRVAGVEARIYPIVLMPSAFEAGMGGGRAAVLNAGAALVDLFRLVDDQNAQGVAEQGAEGATGRGPLSVHFPGDTHLTTLQPATIQTAFLFGRPSDGVSADDLIRSMVSLVISLIGAGPEGGQPFAEAFVNRANERPAMSETGIGKRGVSTAAVASLTIPLAELADVVSSRLLANAVRAMRAAPAGGGSHNHEHLDQFDVASGLEGFRTCAPLREFQDVALAPKGYNAIIQGLADRARSVQDGAQRNERDLASHVAKLAADFNPVQGAETLSRTVDPFRLRRIAVGDTAYADEPDRGGFEAILAERKVPRRAPAAYGFGPNPPQAERVTNRRLGQLKLTDPSVQQVREDQNSWFAWRVEQHWHSAWGASARVWEPRWRSFCAQLTRITDAFVDHIAWDDQHFGERAGQLYASRLGVSYLLPPDDGGLAAFYARVMAALTIHYQESLGPNSTPAHLVSAILSDTRLGAGDGWFKAYQLGREDPEAAVAHVRQRLRAAVSERFRPGGDERPLIPSMKELLAAAVGRARTTIDDADVAHFQNTVAGLVPGGYAPAGEGELTVLVSFPGSEGDREVETFLRNAVLLPSDGPILEFRPNESDSLAVVLFRTCMGITDVPEVREAIQLWGEAQRHERPADRLLWRQRLGPVSHYRAATSADRALILQSILNAMWNGWVQADPDERSPDRVRVGIGHFDSPPLLLTLTPFRELSSWASLLQSYEEWVLSNGDRSDRNLVEQVMQVLPRNVDRNPDRPSRMLTSLVGLQQPELTLIGEVRRRPGISGGEQIDMFEEFWGETLPAALDLPFRGVQAPFANLRGLLKFFDYDEGAE